MGIAAIEQQLCLSGTHLFHHVNCITLKEVLLRVANHQQALLAFRQV